MDNTAENVVPSISLPQDILNMMSNLSHIEQGFIREYLNNGRNATQAYLAIKPDVKFTTANSNGSQILSRTSVKEVVNTYDSTSNAISLTKSVAKRENLINEAHELYELAKNKEQFGYALQGIDLTAKLNRLYEKDREDPGNWQQLVQNILVVNTTTKPVDNSAPVIDVEIDEQ